MNYYNENDPKAAAWLRELIREGHIAEGEIDTRSICEVRATELAGFSQCHFFAGIGGWSYALRLAGWPDNRPVWTGSCPCQPFSAAGKQLGEKDPRHLWPEYLRLVADYGREHEFPAGGPDLEEVANLTGWPSPMAGTPAQNGNNDSSRETVAMVSGWTTPQCHDSTGRSKGQKAKHGTKHGCACLANQALGADLTSSPAGTEKRGALNPAHSRWLMGYPAAWDSCGATAMQSCRNSRQNSSTPAKKL